MEMLDIPLTRENWIAIETMGGDIDDLDAEELSEMPEQFQEVFPTWEEIDRANAIRAHGLGVKI